MADAVTVIGPSQVVKTFPVEGEVIATTAGHRGTPPRLAAIPTLELGVTVAGFVAPNLPDDQV
jgi:hypothetical protein